MTNKHLNNLSIYRIIATICIIQYHVFFILFNKSIPYESLLSKGVQGLTALSGLLYSQKIINDNKQFYLSSTKKLLIPAALCFGLMILWNFVYMLINRNWNYVSLFFDHRQYNGGLLFQPANFYYLIYIFVCYLVTPVLQRNDKFSLLTIVSLVSFELVLGFFVGPSIIIVCYIIGYYIGRKWFKTYVDNALKFRFDLLLLWIAILIVNLGLFIFINVFPFVNGYFLTKLQSLFSNVTMTSFGIATFFVTIYALRFVNNKFESKFLQYIDKLSLFLYLMNQAFMCGAMNVSVWVEPMWAKILTVYFFVIAASCGLEIINRQLLLKTNNSLKLISKNKTA